jgi:hypothetical protein
MQGEGRDGVAKATRVKENIAGIRANNRLFQRGVGTLPGTDSHQLSCPVASSQACASLVGYGYPQVGQLASLLTPLLQKKKVEANGSLDESVHGSWGGIPVKREKGKRRMSWNNTFTAMQVAPPSFPPDEPDLLNSERLRHHGSGLASLSEMLSSVVSTTRFTLGLPEDNT